MEGNVDRALRILHEVKKKRRAHERRKDGGSRHGDDIHAAVDDKEKAQTCLACAGRKEAHARRPRIALTPENRRGEVIDKDARHRDEYGFQVLAGHCLDFLWHLKEPDD